MHDGFVDTRKTVWSRQTQILWRGFLSLLILIAVLMLLALPQSSLSVPYHIGAAIAGVFCVIFLLLWGLSLVNDDRQQFGVDPD